MLSAINLIACRAWKWGKQLIRVAADGFLTGLLLQLAIGPVFFLVLGISIQRTIFDGLMAVLAVTFVDYFYITLAILGVGKLLEKDRVRHILGIVGAAVLAAFGLVMVLSAVKPTSADMLNELQRSNYLASFTSALVLTISSPLTIVFWTGLFATKAAESRYTLKQILQFGLSAGLATLVFLGLTVIALSATKQSIPAIAIQILNVAVGFVLVVYGVYRFICTLRTNHKASKVN
jgi:threonine/homoserine/homoserine lactone efflux protein